jgi:hypothetical protein
MNMNGFWSAFLSQDNSMVHTPYAAMLIAFALASPIICLSCGAVVFHVFIMGKGLDAPTVNLLLGMLGAATGGVISAGISMFSKTTFNQITKEVLPTVPADKGIKPD